MELLDYYTSIVPNERQLMMQDLGFYAFMHFGMNTMTDNQEWGTGKESPSLFNPAHLDTDQWARVVKDAGMKGILLTAKHHDGFCLWQTKTTEHSIKNSPYKNGKGDVVGELAESCRKYGLRFGVYLSPWDRNSAYYGTPQYDDFYIAQLTELMTNYGDLFCIWLDGACGSHLDGKAKQVYDFPRYFAKMNELQPECAISNCGPDVRWCGNEAGQARESEWNVVPACMRDTQAIQDNSQQENGAAFRERPVHSNVEDIGSRKALEGHEKLIWYPAEVDVSIRPGWFYHEKEDKKVRSIDNLLHIFYTSVGGNSLLLLNVPPNKEGLLSEADCTRLHELGERLRSAFAKPVAVKAISGSQENEEHPLSNLLSSDAAYYTPNHENLNYTIRMEFEEKKAIDKVLLKEDTRFSQRVEEFSLYVLNQGEKKKIHQGTVIGFRTIALFSQPVEADGLELEITQCRKIPFLSQIQPFETDYQLPNPPKFQKLKKFFNRLAYEHYVWQENKKEQKNQRKQQKQS